MQTVAYADPFIIHLQFKLIIANIENNKFFTQIFFPCINITNIYNIIVNIFYIFIKQICFKVSRKIRHSLETKARFVQILSERLIFYAKLRIF